MDAAIHPAHGADKPAPVPYLGTRIGGLLVKHKGHELPGVIIRRQVCLMGTRDPIAGIAEVYSVGPDYGSGLRHNTRVSDFTGAYAAEYTRRRAGRRQHRCWDQVRSR